VKVTIAGDPADLRRVTRELRRLEDGRELVADLRRTLQAILAPVAADVKAAYRSAPSRRRGGARRRGGSLRGQLAKVTRVEVRTGTSRPVALVRVDGRKMPDHMRSLPQMWEGEKRWRHPIPSDPDIWVQQPSHPLFDRIVQQHEHRAHAEVEQSVNRLLRRAGLYP
jgi:hypothetical protein